jgi:uncharacterized membrane protein YdjX (TVP38/TMEM64 family)
MMTHRFSEEVPSKEGFRLTWKKALALGLFVIVLCFMLYYYKEIYVGCRTGWNFFTDRERLNAFIASFGIYAPLVFIATQILQVLFAPIPGELTGFVGGYLFGIGPGLFYSTVGLTIGSYLAFTISRHMGLPFVRRFVGQEIMSKFDYLMEHQGAFFSFLFFLIPGTPKDYFCYLLGLSPMHVFTFLIISTIGRFPGTLLLTLQGQAIRDEDYRAFFVVLGIALLLLVVAFLYRDRIEAWLKPKKIFRRRRRWGNNRNARNNHRSKNQRSSFRLWPPSWG